MRAKLPSGFFYVNPLSSSEYNFNMGFSIKCYKILQKNLSKFAFIEGPIKRQQYQYMYGALMGFKENINTRERHNVL